MGEMLPKCPEITLRMLFLDSPALKHSLAQTEGLRLSHGPQPLPLPQSTLACACAVAGTCSGANDLEHKDSYSGAAGNHCAFLGSIRTQSSKSLPVMGTEAGAIFTL